MSAFCWQNFRSTNSIPFDLCLLWYIKLSQASWMSQPAQDVDSLVLFQMANPLTFKFKKVHPKKTYLLPTCKTIYLHEYSIFESNFLQLDLYSNILLADKQTFQLFVGQSLLLSIWWSWQTKSFSKFGFWYWFGFGFVFNSNLFLVICFNFLIQLQLVVWLLGFRISCLFAFESI